ncbi:hypothetical protein DPMN_098337 [Dreissena polymorpha]|uniref:Macro domain-containing protein n=2 Tax=Dreissena polymorpha TaxID=45954 RepID=A0A9D4LDH9_DREPO|nr:hypothetical protein DPMN_098337 [Dreissena polymorpha]
MVTAEEKIPAFLDLIIRLIETHGIHTEGIYRKSGAAAKIKTLKIALDSGATDINVDEFPVHVLTSTLKTFFRELPEPILTFDLYDEFIQASEIKDEREAIQVLFTLTQKLPKVNQDVLERLIFHLARVIQHEQSNKMSANGIAIIFAPCLLRTHKDQGLLEQNNKQQLCIEKILNEQVRKYRETLQDIKIIDQAKTTAEERLTKVRQSIRATQSTTKSMSKKDVESQPLEEDPESLEEQDRVISSHIKSISKEKEELTSGPPMFEYRHSSDGDIDDIYSTEDADLQSNDSPFYSPCTPISMGNVKERDAKYFKFLADQIKGRPNWTYNASTMIITAFLINQEEYEILNDILIQFYGRVSAKVTSKRQVLAVRSIFEDQKTREQFEFAHPLFSENDGDQPLCTLFASNLDDLNRLQELIQLRYESFWSPEIISPRYRLTAHRELFVCIGDIVKYDDKDAGIVNPVIISQYGELVGRGKIFETLKEAGGVEYVSNLSEFDHQDGSFCVTTKGGQLDSLIIHPTRRVSDDQTKKDSFMANVKDCLHVAQKCNLKRLVLPLIYSGAGGVSLKECAFLYACAIYEFCRETRNTNLGSNEIYFVEHNKQKAQSLIRFFNVMFPTSQTQHMFIPNEYARVDLLAGHAYDNQPRLPKVTVNNDHEPSELRVKDETAKTRFDNFKLSVEEETENAGRKSTEVGKDQRLFERSKTKLVIKNADIREEVVDVIVCPEYKTDEFKGFIPNGIRFRFGIERESIEEKVFQTRRIASSRIPVGENRKELTYVYHVKASLFQCGEYPISRNSEDNLRQTVEKVFDKLHRLKHNIKSIAFPLIGSIDVADKDLVKLICSHFINAIFTCCDKRCDPGELEVVIVHPCATITRWLQESLHKKWNAGCS